MTSYEPDEHLANMGVRVIRRLLPTRREGLYLPRLNAVYVQPGLHPHKERSILAHEVSHAEDGTKHSCGNIEWHRIVENRCDRIAAQRLVSFEELVHEMELSFDPGEWASNLRVTGRVIDARLRYLTRAQQATLQELRGAYSYAS